MAEKKWNPRYVLWAKSNGNTPEVQATKTHQTIKNTSLFIPPVWASAWGEDEYGLWAEFDYKGVVQRMRWIAPGRYWMGSPEDEDLWVAVMGENPSRFNERDDCQEFISKLNAEVLGLELRLPTEAEWENACRAGGPSSPALG